MKVFTFIGVIFVVACAHATLFEEYARKNSEWITSDGNLSKLNILSIKISALLDTSSKYGYYYYTNNYYPIFKFVHDLKDFTDRVTQFDRITKLQDSFNAIFDELYLQRETELPSKINELIDEFVSKYIASSVELFDKMLIQSKHLKENAEKLADESIKLIDILAENISKCLIVPKTEFKEVYQCHQNTREILPNLVHNSALLSAICSDLDQLDSIQLNGKTSINQVLSEMSNEKYTLLNNIKELRYQREIVEIIEKDKKYSNNSVKSIK